MPRSSLVLCPFVVIVAASSFYIYQRVWVRNLITQIEEMEQRNEEARMQMGLLKSLLIVLLAPVPPQDVIPCTPMTAQDANCQAKVD